MINVGDALPDMTLVAPDGSALKLSDYRGKKLVLYFYPKDNTPGCTTEAKDFSALLPQFESAGAAVLGVSKDSPKKHQNFIAKQDLTVALASDEEGAFLEAIGVWAEKKMYGKTFMGIIRSTFLIDEKGVVVQAWPKVRVKGHAQEVLDAVSAS